MAQKTVTTASNCGIFYAGSSPSFTIPAGAASYTVQDITGTVLSSGSISGSATSVAPAALAGGWVNGWYLLQITGPSSYYAIFPFSIINNATGFVAVPAWGAASNGADIQFDAHDLASLCIAGMGTYRQSLATPSNAADVTAIKADLAFTPTYLTSDGVRQPVFFGQFPNGAVDSTSLGNLLFCRRGGQTDPASITIGAGTVTGTKKLTITDTNTSTVVETYDNQYTEQQLQANLNAHSAWVYAGGGLTSSSSAPTSGTGTLANTNTLGLINAVSGLYGFNSVGLTWFEGPQNEPGMSDKVLAEAMAFTSVVHAGNASAKALVPSVVSIQQAITFISLCQAVGFTPDGLSFHPYDTAAGDLVSQDYWGPPLAKAIAAAGWGSVPIFQTEFGIVPGLYHTFHPQMSAAWMLNQLAFLESIGVPKERNYYFYPTSHGFSLSEWWRNGDSSLQPQWIAARHAAERLYGSTFANRITFTDPVKRLLFAARWTTASQQTLLFQPLGPSSLSITLSVTGASSVTAYDYAGNASTLTVTGGKVTINPTQLGTWIAAPIAATITVSDVNNGLLNLSPNYADPSVGASTLTTSSASVADQVALPEIFSKVDPLFGDRDSGYGGLSPWTDSGHGMPATVTIGLPAPRRIDRCLIIAPPPFSAGQRNSPIAFTVQYQAPGGSSWLTAYTYSNATAASAALAGSWDLGSAVTWTRINNWDQACVFDCQFGAPILAQAFRIVVTATSMGSAPDAAQNSNDGTNLSQYLQLRFVGLYLTNPGSN